MKWLPLNGSKIGTNTFSFTLKLLQVKYPTAGGSCQKDFVVTKRTVKYKIGVNIN